MKENELRQAFVKKAESYAGVKEGSARHKFIVDTYNTISPLPRNYKVKYTDSWCATFVSAMAKLCGITKIVAPECSCQKQIDLFKQMGAFVENDSYVPSAGDIIYYDWQDSGTGDNTGWADHVGIVVGVNGNKIRVIEGNMNDAVNYRNIDVNGKFIRGFAVPKYASIAEKENPVVAKSETEIAKEWAIKNGVFKGDANGEYNWKKEITREQIAIVLYRLFNKN